MNLTEQRMQFILTLRSNGVSDTAVLAAMESTPRDVFLEGIFKERAYEDRPLPIGRGQTISQPSVVAKMTEALELDNRCKALEVGTGSGYQAAILSKLVRRVYTVERHRPLARAARTLFQELDISNITVVTGDGSPPGCLVSIRKVRCLIFVPGPCLCPWNLPDRPRNGRCWRWISAKICF